MKRCVYALVLLGALALAACGSSVPASNTVNMTSTNFTTHSLSVKAGDQVAFVDPSKGGGPHELYFGNHGQFIANKNGPSELNTKAGVSFNAGDTKVFTFAHTGIYEVTCATNPAMNLLITVR